MFGKLNAYYMLYSCREAYVLYFSNEMEDSKTLVAIFDLVKVNLRLKGEPIDVNKFEIRVESGTSAYKILESIHVGKETSLEIGCSFKAI